MEIYSIILVVIFVIFLLYMVEMKYYRENESSSYEDYPVPESSESYSVNGPTVDNTSAEKIEGKSYEQYIQDVALESDIIKSHKKFNKDVHHRTTTVSKDTVRSDPNDIVPWQGLRRPKYHHGAMPMTGARELPSEAPEQLHEFRSYTL